MNAGDRPSEVTAVYEEAARIWAILRLQLPLVPRDVLPKRLRAVRGRLGAAGVLTLDSGERLTARDAPERCAYAAHLRELGFSGSLIIPTSEQVARNLCDKCRSAEGLVTDCARVLVQRSAGDPDAILAEVTDLWRRACLEDLSRL